MQSFKIKDLYLIQNGEATPGFLLQTPINGLESPPIRQNNIARPGRHGSLVTSQYYDGRPISWPGVVSGENPSQYENNRRALLDAVKMVHDDIGYPLPIPVEFTTLSGKSYFANCYFDAPRFALEMPDSAAFHISGLIADPFIFGAVQVVSPTIAPPTGGGYVVPMIVPYTSAGAAGGSVSLANSGQENAMPIITLTGKLTNPTVTNQTTGKFLQLNYTIPVGSTVIIDMANQTITQDGSSKIATKTVTSDWWDIVPGVNTISVDSTSTSDNGSGLVKFYPPFVGI